MFKRIDHVEIVTDELDRTLRFYTDALGFTLKVRENHAQADHRTSGLAVLSIDPAGCAQSFGTRQLAGVSTTPGLFASVQACEAQKRRVAGPVKTLAFNYNAERVHDECVTRFDA